MHNFTRQQGGTILGIIIGLVIGLGIALAVAVVITKTPTPFTNRLARPEKILPPTPGELSDPNKPLYGKHAPVKDAIQELLERRDQAAAPDSAPQTAGKAPVIELSPRPQSPKAQKAPPASQAPLAKANVAHAGTGPASAAAGKWSYYLQVGAFRNKTEAENLRGKLALAGVEAGISERQSENGALYRVRTGPFNQSEAMNQVRSKLSENGIDAAVVRVARQ